MSRGSRIAIFANLFFVCALVAGCGGGSSVTAPTVTTTQLANGTVGTAYSGSLTASGGTPPYIWIEVSGGGLPNGLTLTSTGAITGTPSAAGTYGPYIFLARDNRSATAATPGLMITIAATGGLVTTTTSLPDGTVRTAYSASLLATGGTAPYTWAQTTGGALPAGVILGSDGTFSGTPTAAGLFGPYTFSVTDNTGAVINTVPLTITIAGTTTTACVPQGDESALSATTPYAFLLKGSDPNGAPVDIAGSFTPNGVGGIKAASVDSNGFSNGPIQFTVDTKNSAYSFASGTQQGCLYLAFSARTAADRTGNLVESGEGTKASGRVRAIRTAKSGASATPAITVTIPTFVQFTFYLGQFSGSVYQSGRITESDNFSRASGIIHSQTLSNFSIDTFRSNYAFGADGWTTPDGINLSRIAIAGTFQNTGGALSLGYADYNQGGIASGPLSGGSGLFDFTINSKTGRGTGSYMTPTPGGTLAFNFVLYVLNSSDFLLLSSDSPLLAGAPPLLAGRVLSSQANYSASPLNGSFLFASEGFDASGASGQNFVQIGTLSATNSGAVPTATVYTNYGGTFAQNVYTNNTYTVDAASGRTVAAGVSATPPIAYLTDSSSDDNIAAFTVGTDLASSSGVFVNQSSGTPAYSLASLTGLYGVGSNEDIDNRNGTYLATTSFNAAGGYTISSPLTIGTIGVVPLLGTYTVNADGSGTLDGNNFTIVTTGTEIYAVPQSGDPLLFIFLQ